MMTVRGRGRNVPGKTQTKRRSCDGKDRFYDENAAQRSRDRRIAAGALPSALRVYPCQFCSQWHVGHTPGNQMKR